MPLGAERFEIDRALAHGHVAAALGTVRRLGLDKVLPNGPERRARLILAMIVARIIEPAAKLATARQLSEATAAHSLGAVLGLGEVDEDELYAALDLLGRSQAGVEKVLADATSRTACSCSTMSPRAIWRGGAANWRNSATAATIGPIGRRSSSVFCARRKAARSPSRCSKATSAIRARSPIRFASCATRFRLKRIVLVGDRGMITQARIDADLEPAGLDWITALRAPAIKALAAEGGPLQLSLFDERDMAEIASDDYPGERLVVCRNPELAAERTRKRAELLEATEKALVKIGAMTEKNAIRSAARTRSPSRSARSRSSPHGQAFRARHHRYRPRLVAQGRGDRRGSRARRRLCHPKLLPGDGFPAAAVVLAYKGLSHAERGFRDLKSGDLDVRPIHHRRAHRVRAHVFLCMLAYYVIWHMKRDLAPMLFKDDDPAAAAAQRSSPVAKAKVSPAARQKAITRRAEDGQPVHSFRTLLQDLANLTRNSVRFGDARPTTILARPTQTQNRAFDLLGLKIAA